MLAWRDAPPLQHFQDDRGPGRGSIVLEVRWPEVGRMAKAAFRIVVETGNDGANSRQQLTILGAVAPPRVPFDVDPFGFFGVNRTGYYFNSEREFKLQQVDIVPHDGLLLGNSKMAYVDPDDLPGYEFFNAAFSGAKPLEMLQFLEVHSEGVDKVALALDIRMFFLYDDETLPAAA